MEQKQVDIFSEEYQSGEYLRDVGITKAIDNADKKHENWSDLAYEFLRGYIEQHSEFMAEDLRAASTGTIPDPPSLRAWGGVIVRAVKEGLISRKEFRNVQNPKAHRTPATLWEVVNYQKE